MAKYIAKGYKLGSGKEQESNPDSLSMALLNADRMLKSNQYEVIVILRDSEGEDHPDNAGKYFLYRIIK